MRRSALSSPFRKTSLSLIRMKTAGILGGIGPESTVEYYRLIISAYRQQKQDGSYPYLLIHSIDLKRMLDLVAANELSQLVEFLCDGLQKLVNAGADFALLASNTPHIVFGEISRRSAIPLISIVEAACDSAKALGLKKVGLFGTRFTMQGRFYPDVFLQNGIEIAVPPKDDQDYVHEKYLGELVNGINLDETRANFLRIVDRMKEDQNIEGLILGGTEFPLLFRHITDYGIPFLDTTKIHVDHIVARLLSDNL